MTLQRTGIARKKTLARRTPMPRAKAGIQRRARKVIARQRDTGPTTAVKGLVLDRAGGCCEICGARLHDGTGWVVAHSHHHRRPRGAGGSSRADTNAASNLLLLCGSATTPGGCHADVEKSRERALAYGWLIHQGQDPGAQPVLVRDGWGGMRRVLLTDDGTYTEVAA